MHSTSKLLSLSLCFIGTLIAQGPPPGGPGGPHGPGGFGGPPVTGAPFSAVKTATHVETLTDGNQITQTRTEKIYRDSDGRTRTEATITTPSGDTRTVISIADPVAGFIVHLNPADSTAMKMTLHTPPANTPKPPAPPANAPAATKTDLGTQTIAGVSATGTRINRTIPAGAVGNTQSIVETHEVWLSTALQVPVKMTTIDPQRGNTTMLMSNIVQAAQDPTLFQIPSSFTVNEAPAGPGPHGHMPGDLNGPPPPPSL